jgi:outer membrane protein OmpA-like peptidoglycan-associated protein
MKFPKLISSLVLVASIYSSNAQVSKWPLGFGPENSFGFAIGSDKTGDLYFVKSIYDDDNGFFIDKIMHTKLNESGNWTEPEMMPPPVNDNFNNAVVGLSENADTLYLLGNYRAAHPRLRSGLSYAVKNEKNEWEIAGTIKLPQLQPVTEFYGFYVNTKQDVILASFETKKRNSDDIYIARLIDGKTGYSDLIALPENINTKASEISPSISDDGKTLTFARFVKDENGSNYHLFSSEAIGDDFTQWTEPRPLSITYSENFDAYYWCCMDNIAFFSSDRDRPGLSAIYTFENISKEDLYAAVKLNTKKVASTPYWDSALNGPMPKNRVLNGTIESENTEFKNQKLALVSLEGDTLDQAVIDENGTFTFNNVPNNDNYEVKLVDEPIDENKLSAAKVSLRTNDGGQARNVALNQLPMVSTKLLQLEALENNLALQKMVSEDYREAATAPKPLSGKIESESTEFTFKKLALIAPNGDILDIIDVAPDGTFKFSNMPIDADYEVKLMSNNEESISDADDVFISIMNESGVSSERMALNELPKASAGLVQTTALDNAIASRKMIYNEEVKVVPSASTLSGKIENQSSEFKYQKLALIGINGDTLELADVAEDGTFMFTNVPNDAKYEVKVAGAETDAAAKVDDLISLQTESGVAIENIRMSQMPEIGSKLLQLEAINNQIASKVEAENATIAANTEANAGATIADANVTYERASDAITNATSEQIAEATQQSNNAANAENNNTAEQTASTEAIAEANVAADKAQDAITNATSEQIAEATQQSNNAANAENNKTAEQTASKEAIAEASAAADKAKDAITNATSEQIAEATQQSNNAANAENNKTAEQTASKKAIAEANAAADKAKDAITNATSEQIAEATQQSVNAANAENNKKAEQTASKEAIAEANAAADKAQDAITNATSEQIAEATQQSNNADNADNADNAENNKTAEQTASKEAMAEANAAQTKTAANTDLSTNEEGVSVYFDFNSASLNSKAKYQLEQLKAKLITLSEIKASADTSGAKAYNQDLSENRANTIAEFLNYSGTNAGLGEVSSNSPDLARRGVITPNIDAMKDQKGELFSIILYHPFNNQGLESTSEMNLEYAALLLKKHAELNLVIKAHSDTQGDAAYNLLLSKKRAEQIESILIQFGVNQEQITSKWFGETESINNCQVIDCGLEERALDRRTELQIIKP